MTRKRGPSALALAAPSFGTRTPKHRLISGSLLDDVEPGRWKPGDQIPSEQQLAAENNASLGTIQRALRNLVDMGVLIGHHGRGTFLALGRRETVSGA
jgi:GntR family transcriptional regulator